jgi:antirestriction protein
MTYEKAQALSVRFFEKNEDARHCWIKSDQGAIFAAWIENFHLEKPSEYDWEECKDCFQGEFRNAGDFAEHICDGCGTLDDMPEGLKPYFDYDAFGRDLILGGDYWQSGEYYFNNK